MSHLIFVFGTLKEGFPNFAINRGRRIPGEFVTALPFPLYLVGERCSPWLVNRPGEGTCVTGQVFEADDAALAQMDRLERTGEPDGYQRLPIEVLAAGTAKDTRLTVFAYLKPPSQFTLTEARHGPLAVYSLTHAARYKSRSAVP